MRESQESDSVIAVVDDDPSIRLGLQRLIRSMGWQAVGKLKITEDTVKFHRGHIIRNMRADSLADLVRMAQNLEIAAQRSDRT
jgi:FixJ family two-component response regulator